MLLACLGANSRDQADGGVKADEAENEDEGEAGGGKVDMKVLAKGVDVQEVEKVLKVGLFPPKYKTFTDLCRRTTRGTLCLTTSQTKGNSG